MKTVVLIDDHVLFRRGVRAALEPSFAIVGEGATSDEAVGLAVSWQPEVLVLDVEIPGGIAADTIRRLRRAAPGVAVVVLTMYSDKALERQLLEAGASAFVAKTMPEATLLGAVERAQPPIGPPPARCRGGRLLSDRELEVLRLIAQSFSNAEIAARLHIAEGTVKRHTSNIYDKLGAASRIDAVRKADRLGLFAADSND